MSSTSPLTKGKIGRERKRDRFTRKWRIAWIDDVRQWTVIGGLPSARGIALDKRGQKKKKKNHCSEMSNGSSRDMAH